MRRLPRGRMQSILVLRALLGITTTSSCPHMSRDPPHHTSALPHYWVSDGVTVLTHLCVRQGEAFARLTRRGTEVPPKGVRASKYDGQGKPGLTLGTTWKALEQTIPGKRWLKKAARR